ncbi:MAG TPA: pirin family protein [Bryobacterales bacterium]|nr:pirin family protein [Bryobacterales bacterium]
MSVRTRPESRRAALHPIDIPANGRQEDEMIQVIRSGERHHEDMGWLSTYWHFSFDTYYDPANMNWGPLRVFNDDMIQPGKGFGMHPHRDMEIISYVVAGALQHRDSQGNEGVVRAGEVQVMSAGSGIVHSEFNPAAEPVHLMQIWIQPRTKGLRPRWEQKRFSRVERSGKLLPVVSFGDVEGTLAIDQDCVVYLSSLRKGQQVSHVAKSNRKGYLFVIDGAVNLNSVPLATGDQARIDQETKLAVETRTGAELIFLDLPATSGG